MTNQTNTQENMISETSKPQTNDADFAKLEQMQLLCNQLSDDVAQLEATLEKLDVIEQRKQQLIDLYQNDWLRINEYTNLSEQQKQQLLDIMHQANNDSEQPAKQSVQCQDTIFNALTNSYDVYKGLIQSLAMKL